MSHRYSRAGDSSRSYRAGVAEGDGRRPWSRLTADQRRGLTKPEALKLGLSWEWHHTSLHANRTDYFDPEMLDIVLDGFTRDELKAAASIDWSPLGDGPVPTREARETAMEISRRLNKYHGI